MVDHGFDSYDVINSTLEKISSIIDDTWDSTTGIRTWKINLNVDINKSGTEYYEIESPNFEPRAPSDASNTPCFG
jgi:hypothetical protein